MSKIDFKTPQRLSKKGLILNFLQGIKKLGSLLIWLPLLFIRKFRENEWPLSYLVLFIAIFLILVLVNAILRYRNFKFYIDEEDQNVVCQKGVFSKTKVMIHFDKIQQVNITQNVVQQALDFYQLEIETSGTSQSEITLNALNEETAQAFKSYLFSKKTDKKEGHLPIEERKEIATEFVHLKNNKILFTAAFSSYFRGFGISLLLLYTVGFNLYETLRNYFFAEKWLSIFFDTISVIFYSILVLCILTLPFLVNMFRFGVKFYKMKYSSNNEQGIHTEYGLFKQQNRIIQIPKIQQFKIQNNPLLKGKNLYLISLKQIQEEENLRTNSTIYFPGINQSQLNDLLLQVFGKGIIEGNVFYPHLRKKWIGIIVATTLFLIMMLIGIVYINSSDWTFYTFFSTTYLFALLVIWIRFKREKISVNDDLIIIEKGFWDLRKTIIQPHKIQKISLKQLPWQVKSNIGSLTIHTASGMIHLNMYDYNTLLHYYNYWLMLIENSEKEWH